MFLTLGAIVGFSTFVLISALWGYAASWVNEVLKQDHWSKTINALIANAVLIVSAAMATMTDATFTLKNFFSALLAAATAAVANHQFFLEPTGVGKKLQTLTSWRKK